MILFLALPYTDYPGNEKLFECFDVEWRSIPINRTVHENLVVEGSIAVASSELHHFGYDDPNVFFSKQIKYAQLRAADKLQKRNKGQPNKATFYCALYVWQGICSSGPVFFGVSRANSRGSRVLVRVSKRS